MIFDTTTPGPAVPARHRPTVAGTFGSCGTAVASRVSVARPASRYSAVRMRLSQRHPMSSDWRTNAPGPCWCGGVGEAGRTAGFASGGSKES